MKIACVSDTHWTVQGDVHPSVQLLPVPEADVLIHAGDATFKGQWPEIEWLVKWFAAQPHKHKIFVPGNHDLCFDDPQAVHYARKLLAGVHVLIDQGTEIDGVKFWGTPYQPEFHNWAFNVDEQSRHDHFALIPDDTDVLITHCPPFGFLDKVKDTSKAGVRVGCKELLKAVQRVDPKLHVFGHIHGSYGRVDTGRTQFVNAAMCDEDYQPVNPVRVVEI